MSQTGYTGNDVLNDVPEVDWNISQLARVHSSFGGDDPTYNLQIRSDIIDERLLTENGFTESNLKVFEEQVIFFSWLFFTMFGMPS